jgi:hypothetical protein
VEAGETLGVIMVLDYDVAANLKQLGFNYSTIESNNCTLYQFIESDDLRKELMSTYDKGSFFMSKNICY